MSTSYEKISKNNASSQGKTDSNLSNDSNHLGGVSAEEYATKKYVQDYHDNKEQKQKEYIDEQDTKILEKAKEHANSLVRNQDFSGFAKNTDIEALDTKLSNEISTGLAGQQTYTDNKVQGVVDDVNSNFGNVSAAINNLNTNQKKLFQSVSDGKKKIAGAITDKGVTTSANDTFDTMATNIRNIPNNGSGGNIGTIPEGYVDTRDATADASKILSGYSAYANGKKLIGTYVDSGSGGTGENTDVTELYNTVDPTFEVTNVGVTREYEYDNDKKEYTGRVLLPVETFAISKSGQNIVYETKMYDVGKENNKYITATKDEVEASTFVGRYIETRKLADSGMSITEDSEGKRMKCRYSFEELGLDTEKSIDGMSFGKVGLYETSYISLLCIMQGSTINFYAYDERYSGAMNLTDYANYHWTVSTEDYWATSIPAGTNQSPNMFGCFAINGKYNVILLDISENSSEVNFTVTQMSLDSHSVPLSNQHPTFFSEKDGYLISYSDKRNTNGAYGAIYIIAGINNKNVPYTVRSTNICMTFTGKASQVMIAVSPDENYILVNSTIYRLAFDTTELKPSFTELFRLDIDWINADCPEGYFSNDNKYLYIRYKKYVYRYQLDFENNTATKDNEWGISEGYSSRGNFVFDLNGLLHFTSGSITDLGRLYQKGTEKKLIGVIYKGNKFYLPGESEVTE